MQMKIRLFPSLPVATLCALSTSSEAALTFTIEPIGGGTALLVTGFLQYDFGIETPVNSTPTTVSETVFRPDQSSMLIGTVPPPAAVKSYQIIANDNSFPSSFGNFFDLPAPLTLPGNPLMGFDWASKTVIVPADYTSGTALPTEIIYENVTLADLGLVPGTSFFWGTEAEIGGGASILDGVTVDVVPEPSAALLAGFASVVLLRRRRQV